MARGAILDSDSDDGAAPEEELAEERDAATDLEDQYAYKAKPMGEYDIRTMTCLLYTSPSPRDRTRSRMPSSA